MWKWLKPFLIHQGPGTIFFLWCLHVDCHGAFDGTGALWTVLWHHGGVPWKWWISVPAHVTPGACSRLPCGEGHECPSGVAGATEVLVGYAHATQPLWLTFIGHLENLWILEAIRICKKGSWILIHFPTPSGNAPQPCRSWREALRQNWAMQVSKDQNFRNKKCKAMSLEGKHASNLLRATGSAITTFKNLLALFLRALCLTYATRKLVMWQQLRKRNISLHFWASTIKSKLTSFLFFFRPIGPKLAI